MEEKDAFCSETAVTYLLYGQTHFYATPIAYQKKPNRKLGLRFGKEETSLENKKHRFAMIRFGKVVSDVSPTAISFPSRGKRYGRKGRFLLRNRRHVSALKLGSPCAVPFAYL